MKIIRNSLPGFSVNKYRKENYKWLLVAPDAYQDYLSYSYWTSCLIGCRNVLVIAAAPAWVVAADFS